MALTRAQIRSTRSDEELLKLLQEELNVQFPPAIQQDLPVLLSRYQTAPRGLRAMAATYHLDVSLALDDLAWHFVNHPSRDLSEETQSGLQELEQTQAAELFERAFLIVQPHWDDLEARIAEGADSGAMHDWLDSSGIQKAMDPLTKQFWKLLEPWPDHGLMHHWTVYARKYPERCG